MTQKWHIGKNNLPSKCRAKTPESCPIKGSPHAGSEEEIYQIIEERAAEESSLVDHIEKSPEKETEIRKPQYLTEFSSESYNGKVPPREIQLEALSGVMSALEEEDSTQLVAACGTGKTYMGRQILSSMMNKEDSNGIGVVLTSSIKLAEDTAGDMRGKDCDQAFGEYGKDYEVIEVHSGVKGKDSVLSNGSISVDKIHAKMQKALEEDKKIVIVSTYESSAKVKEAQSTFEDSDRVSADILMHDEAHNILGQQTTKEGGSFAYTGFDNEIPGSIQSKKRLYATATPVVKEVSSDDSDVGDLERAKKIAEDNLNKKSDRIKRITVYSDNEAIVGKIGGYISQEDAIRSNCLANPEYSVREASISGNIADYTDPVVGPDGRLRERDPESEEYQMKPQTYAAVDATLKAMVSDPEDGKNPTHNVLAYTGSIEQSKAFRDGIRRVAEAKSEGMSSEEAQKLAFSEDAHLRERARMKLLSENLSVKAAHSGEDSESKIEKKEAFDMFHGKDVKSSEWTPHKNVLANVDIFSEGVNIPEIDSVVISDEKKMSERSMTQAIGRSIRKVGGNDFKNTGHVILPSSIDSEGNRNEENSVSYGIYGATRVQRGTATAKIKGEAVKPDTKTEFSIHRADGSVERKAAGDIIRDSVSNADDLVASYTINSVNRLIREPNSETSDAYKKATEKGKVELIRKKLIDDIEKAEASGKDGKEISPAAQKRIMRNQATLDYMRGKSASQILMSRKRMRVVHSAINSGDISSLNPKITKSLVSAGLIDRSSSGNSNKSSSAEITPEEKTQLSKDISSASVALTAFRHPSLSKDKNLDRISKGISEITGAKDLKRDPSVQALNRHLNGLKTGDTESKATDLQNKISEKIDSDPEFRDAIYNYYSTAEKKDPLDRGYLNKIFDFAESNLKKSVDSRKTEAASNGEESYTMNPSFFSSNGEIRSSGIDRILKTVD